MIKRMDVVELAILWIIGLVVLFLLYGCGTPIEQPIAPTQTARVIVVTATELQTAVPTLQNTVEPTDDCPPEYLANITVGYVPGLDLGDKKAAVATSQGCALLVVMGNGWRLSGQVAPDGLSLVTCTLSTDRDYPCELVIRNLDSMNIVSYYENKVGKNHAICLAVSNKDYNVDCE